MKNKLIAGLIVLMLAVPVVAVAQGTWYIVSGHVLALADLSLLDRSSWSLWMSTAPLVRQDMEQRMDMALYELRRQNPVFFAETFNKYNLQFSPKNYPFEMPGVGGPLP